MKVFTKLKFVIALLICVSISSCIKEDEHNVSPPEYETYVSGITTLRARPLPNKVKLMWKNQLPVTFEKIIVTYTDGTSSDTLEVNKDKEEVTVENLNSNNVYTFTLIPYASDGTEGKHKSVKGKPGIFVPISGVTSITYQSLPGKIKLTWEQEKPVTYEKLIIKYHDPRSNTDEEKELGKSDTEVYIENTLARHNDYSFTFTTYDAEGDYDDSKIKTIKAKSGKVPASMGLTPGNDREKLTIDASKLSTNAKKWEPLENLVNGNEDDFFETDYTSLKNWRKGPHYFAVELPKPVRAFSYTIIPRARNHGGDIKEMDIYASNDGQNWDKVASHSFTLREYTSVQTPSEGGPVLLDQEYKHLKFVPTEIRKAGKLDESNNKYIFFNLAEIYIYNEPVEISDPENE